VYSALAHRLAAHQGEVYPLHVGDTWMEPPAGCRMEDLRTADHPGMHRYGPPQGLPALLAALAERTAARSGVPTGPDEVLVAAGATGALGAAVGALVDPGEEVLVLAPHWPLISGIVRSLHATPVAVPAVAEPPSAEAVVGQLAAHRTARSAAVYLNSPNNPTGRLLPPAVVEAVVGWARGEGLWLLADEVYEDYVYRGEHRPVRALAPERTVAAMRKVSTHTFYATPTAAQLAALRALQGPGDAWVAEARRLYREVGDAAADRLGVARPEGSTFLFLDVAPALGGEGLDAFLSRCADRGLFLAPGPSFGPFPTHLRLCFTSAPPEVVLRGVALLAEILGR